MCFPPPGNKTSERYQLYGVTKAGIHGYPCQYGEGIVAKFTVLLFTPKKKKIRFNIKSKRYTKIPVINK